MTLHLLDAYRQPFSGTYRVKLMKWPGLSVVMAPDKDYSAPTVTFDVQPEHALFHAEVWAEGHRPVFVKGLGDSTVRVPIPVDPESKRLSVSWPERVPEDVRALWADLSDVERACLLNIRAKLVASALWEQVQEITDVDQDRIYCHVSDELKSMLASSPAWTPVSGSLHTPPPGSVLDSSFKHAVYDAGVLQITLFTAGDVWLADIDIDDAGGLGHVFQVLDHWLTRSATHPYDIHQILVYRQGIDPGYRLQVTS